MAKPKIFISSTFYDLRQVRSDLQRFVKELGYEPVLNEDGNIPYGKDHRLEDYCYKEINNTDILVSIIGGRYGSESKNEPHSISQMELKVAHELNKQIYIFIQKGVFNEYQFYKMNKDNGTVKYSFVEDIKIHQFIETVENLPSNNTIHPFETSIDITTYLKEQWAGLFQRFLQEQTRIKEINVIKGIENTAKTLDQLVTFLKEEKQGSDNTITEILLSNHPAMGRLKELLKIPFRVYFSNRSEFSDYLSAYGYSLNDTNQHYDGYQYWIMERQNTTYTVRVDDYLFNGDNKLNIFTKDEWKDDYITLEEEDDDGLPF